MSLEVIGGGKGGPHHLRPVQPASLAAGPAIECARCAVSFWVTERFQSQRREDHREFYCPSGHAQHYPAKTPTDSLRDELLAARDQLAAVTAERDALLARARPGSFRAWLGALLSAKPKRSVSERM